MASLVDGKNKIVSVRSVSSLNNKILPLQSRDLVGCFFHSNEFKWCGSKIYPAAYSEDFSFSFLPFPSSQCDPKQSKVQLVHNCCWSFKSRGKPVETWPDEFASFASCKPRVRPSSTPPFPTLSTVKYEARKNIATFLCPTSQKTFLHTILR